MVVDRSIDCFLSGWDSPGEAVPFLRQFIPFAVVQLEQLRIRVLFHTDSITDWLCCLGDCPTTTDLHSVGWVTDSQWMAESRVIPTPRRLSLFSTDLDRQRRTSFAVNSQWMERWSNCRSMQTETQWTCEREREEGINQLNSEVADKGHWNGK